MSGGKDLASAAKSRIPGEYLRMTRGQARYPTTAGTSLSVAALGRASSFRAPERQRAIWACTSARRRETVSVAPPTEAVSGDPGRIVSVRAAAAPAALLAFRER